ncbi:MAG TPA: sensor histidine kinase KdpD [Bacteroidota bacterium]|nr:sensor histidine kinase KdpD [Bacteroidota bacterium]
MPRETNGRMDPESLLRSLKRSEEKEGKGHLKIFFGMCAGVGKTYEMLQAAQEAKKKATDVVVGYVETHGRKDTEKILEGLPIVPRKKIDYKGAGMEEMDLDAILAHKPALVIVDELAHTNAPGSRHTKRYLDVLELLDNGIDVYSALNVQHLESRADTVAQITGSIIRETVPDSVFEQADEVEVIDLPPDELLRRLAEGKVYTPERSQRAIENFFRKGNLTALREMCLRIATERVEHQLRDYMQVERISGPWKSGQRLIMGISPSPTSVRLIRWVRRMAFTMQASWVAVYVERSVQLSTQEKEQLAKNIALARELGAEIITTADENVADALLRVAREQNVTQVIVGKSEVPSRFQQSILNRLIDLSGDLDVYIVGGDEKDWQPRQRWRLPVIQSGALQYAIAIGLVALVAASCFPFSAVIGYQTVSLLLLLLIALLPLRFGVGPIIAAAVLSALVWDYFFIPPFFTFAIHEVRDVLMVIIYFAIAIVAGVLTVRVRNRERAVRLREERTSALYALTNDLSVANTQEEVVAACVKNIRKYFGAEVAIFLSTLEGDFVNMPHPKSTFSPGEKELSVPAWVHWNERKAGKFTNTLPFAEATYFPLVGPRYPMGVIGIRNPSGQRFTIDQETLLENFISQITLALDREFLNEMAKQSIALAESERLYTTLFNSISHEMRTPITALMSATEGLLNDQVGGRPEIRRELAHEVEEAAERLDQIVQNLLAMTRLESGLIKPKLDWCDLRDIINSSIRKLRGDLQGRPINVHVADAVPLLKLDFGLMEQVLLNLLQNAVMYTPRNTPITISAQATADECTLTVADTGPGFPPEAIGKVFEKFFRVPGSKAGGLGLGLSIALGFIHAHNGSLTVENLSTGGALLTIRLPISERPHSPEMNANEYSTDHPGH